ncbi:MAG: 2-hydroxyacid dehydrogenase, partial [Spirochaetota bacterium]
KLLALRSAGYNHVDLDALKGKIDVVRVPAYSPHAVSEHALALMLTLNRKTHRAYSRTRDNNFAISGLLGFDMNEKVAGIVGTGQIGRIMCEILRGLNMRVLAYDPYPNKDWATAHGVEYVALTELYRNSDVISLHCPLTAENVHMIDRASMAQMKNGVMIINTGRGKLIRTEDLLEALKNRKVGAAGLDVYEEETDFFFEDHSSNIINDDNLLRLLAYPNVLITSHQAFFTREAMTNIARITLENIRMYYEEGRIVNPIPDFDAQTGRLSE